MVVKGVIKLMAFDMMRGQSSGRNHSGHMEIELNGNDFRVLHANSGQTAYFEGQNSSTL